MTDPLRVLVVDDDFMVARVHHAYVERVPGFEVVGEARTGGEALEAVREHRPDLVLLDIYLPDMSGLEVLRSLRAADDPVDVLVISAARDLATVESAYRGGVVQYLIKPFTAAELEARLTEYRRRRRSMHHAASQRDGSVAQREVDALFGKGAAVVSDADLPKGLTLATLRLVASALREHTAGPDETMGAADCAEAAGLARVSARRYLEHLVQIGRAEVSLRYGQAGRPQRRYRWTGEPSGRI
ncbi:MAG: response regulator [Actinomycetota bacterium]|nr:response regulator [Actinomycetota bacterium]